MSNKYKILTIVLVVVAAAGVFIYSEWNRTPEELQHKEADVRITAQNLLHEFASDTSLASKKYIDKVLRVSGYVKSFDTSGVITLGMPDEISSIQCSMDDRKQVSFSTLNEGKQITIKGVCNGYQNDELLGTDVKMNYCVLVND